MKTLYKNSHLVAAAIIGALLLSASAAVAVTGDDEGPAAQVESVGTFVVTPHGTTFVAPPELLGRFVVTQHGAVFVPATA